MIEIYENTLLETNKPGRYLFALMMGCLNPATNRLELRNKPLNSIDLCAYANIEMSELSKAIKELLITNSILIVRAKGKEFFYANPYHIRDSNSTPEEFEWLLQMFEEEANQEDKDLVYFKRGKKNISVRIGEAITDLK